MQLHVPTMLKSDPFATTVAEDVALWHSAQSSGLCLCLASVKRVSGEGCAAKLIVFPEWDNLVQFGDFAARAGRPIVSIN